jgi:hypothetical protein
MATVRIQVRRGLASQWTSTNPILAAGEMGVETDTNKFKFGNGTATWSALSYANADVAGITEISQDAIDAALTMGTGLTKTYDDGANTITLSINDTVWATKAYVDEVATDLGNTADSSYIPQEDRGAVNGVASLNAQGKVPTSETDLTVMATRAYAEYLQSQDLIYTDAHAQKTLNVHGIPDTAEIATLTALATGLASAEVYADAKSAASNVYTDGAITTTTSYIDDKHGEALQAAIDAETNANTYTDNKSTQDRTYSDGILSGHDVDTTNVHGIADTTALATKSYADTAASTAQTSATSAASTALATHEGDTTNVHGIADTSALALTATVDSALALKAPLDSPTFTGTVSGITKTMVGLENVDNTADSAKPVSTAAQTALDLKAPLDSPSLTGVPTAPTAAAGTATTQVATTEFVGTAVSALVASSPSALDTLNELATALGNDASFSTTITNSIATKSPIESPTFTGTVTAPEITATGLVTASASGIAFTDGTQTKEGVPSRTPISQKSEAYTLSSLTERDTLIEVGSASAVSVTIPPDSAVDYPIGTSIDVLQTSTGQVTIAAGAGVTVNATPGLKLRTQWSSASLLKRAANTWIVLGDLSA